MSEKSLVAFFFLFHQTIGNSGETPEQLRQLLYFQIKMEWHILVLLNKMKWIHSRVLIIIMKHQKSIINYDCWSNLTENINVQRDDKIRVNL